ncbi:MAG: PDZ domain-containing protein [Armatimonadetes bacterium]|nr:PDZ domain-containing protein [Armatimonadota bacterium]
MKLFSGALALVMASAALAGPIKRIQYPAISPDGSTVLFSWQNDIWSVARTGGMATRLTVHAAIDSRPVWFRDGSRVAFASARYGSTDIFTMRPDGTDLRRVTYDSSAEIPTSVSPDGRFIYGQTNLWSRGDLFRVPVIGGDLQRLTSHPFEAPFAPFVSADGTKVYYNRGSYRETAWQKPTMQSSALPEIWVADNTVPLSNHRRLTNNEFTDLTPQVMPDGTIFAVTNRGGFPNVWRLGKGDVELTHHKDGTSRNLTVSRDGRYISYEFESALWVYDTTKDTDVEVPVTVPDDSRTNPIEEISLAGGIEQMAVSPDGKRVAAYARGDIFLLPEKGGTTRRLTTNPARDYSPQWLNPKTIVYTAMEDSRRRLKTVTVDGVVKDFIVDPSAEIHTPVVSPDGKTVAYHKGGDEIWLADAEGKNAHLLVKGNFRNALDGGVPTFSWSPDNAYIATTLLVGRRTDVALVDVKTGKTTVVAKMVDRPQKGDVSVPQFTPNGRALFFTSPEFDFPDLFIVDLVPPDVTFSEDDLDKIDTPPSKEKVAPEVKIYEPNLDKRLRRLTNRMCAGAVANPDGKSLIALTDEGLQSIDVATGKRTTLMPDTAIATIQSIQAANGKVYVINNGRMATLSTAGPAASFAPISFNAQYSVDARDEEKALFEEVWWAMGQLYYDPGMNKKDWNGIRDKYAKIVPYAYDRSDFYRLMGEMMEELDSSHLGSTAPPADYPGSNDEATAFLGIDLDPVALGRNEAVVGRVVPNSPADQPYSLLKVGDAIKEVDGEAVGSTPLAALLNRKLLKKVDLTIERDGKRQHVLIKPGSNALRSELEYEAFIDGQREMVHKLSNDRLGYLHIRAFDQTSLDKFLREIRTEGEGKKGMIIDVRFNGGGSTAVDVLGVLIKRPWMMRSTRGDFGLKLSENIFRGDALEQPTALMENTFSFSNAEVITEGFRALKLGPIIGERTPGYLIGTGAYSLWDGGRIRMPAIGAYAVNGTNLENNGRKPDHTVWFDPNAWMQGRDLQTERAVVELLKSVKD